MESTSDIAYRNDNPASICFITGDGNINKAIWIFDMDIVIHLYYIFLGFYGH